MHFNEWLLKLLIANFIGLLLAYLAFIIPKKTLDFIYSAKSKKIQKIHFLLAFFLRYIIYAFIIIIGFAYFKINAIFVIISFTLFFIIILFFKYKKIKALK